MHLMYVPKLRGYLNIKKWKGKENPKIKNKKT